MELARNGFVNGVIGDNGCCVTMVTGYEEVSAGRLVLKH